MQQCIALYCVIVSANTFLLTKAYSGNNIGQAYVPYEYCLDIINSMTL